jgi:hypothetical protein
MADEQGKPALLMKDIVKEASSLREKRLELNTLRQDDNKQWAQNREFYKGNQWVFWSESGNRLETYGVNEGQKPRYKVRLTANVILPGVQQLVAQMTKTRPVIRATPDSGADRDIKAAEMAERLYEYWTPEFGLGAKTMSAMTHAQISQGYWLITWDQLAGKSMKVMLDPESQQPIWDEVLADGFRDDIREIADQLGIPQLIEMFEQTIYLGDIRVQALSGEQVWLDPTATNFEDSQYAICKFPMTVDEIDARYKKKVVPNASTAEPAPSLIYTRPGAEGRPKNVRDVYMLYHKPSAAMPGGKYVVWIEDPNEILYQSAWEFPFHWLPLVKFPGIERPGNIYDEARVSHARGLQKELNNTVSGIAMYKNLSLRPQMLAPVGSLRDKLTDEPGAVIQFAPFQGLAPEWRPSPPLPAYVFEYLANLQMRLDRLFNIMPTERSALPARTDSGHLVELVQEAVADQISPEIHRMEAALARAGDIMVAYAQKYYVEPRLLKIIGPGGSVQTRKFLNADLQGGFSFSAEAGSGLPRTRAGKTQHIKEMVEMQVLDPREAVQYLDIAGLKGIQNRMKADEELAHRHIEKLIHGEPLNIPALEQAIQMIQTTGQNPETGDFFQDENEAIAYVEQASLSPLPYENPQVSMYVLGQHMKSIDFEKYDPDAQHRFFLHYELLQQAASAGEHEGEPVKTTLSLKGTIGPTGAAQILQQGGLQGITPETMAEQPLETSVYDSMDKPDMDEAGNDPLTDEEKLLSIQQAAATHTLKMAKAQNQLARATDTDEQDDEDRALKRVRDEEIHQERLRVMRQPKPAKAK